MRCLALLALVAFVAAGCAEPAATPHHGAPSATSSFALAQASQTVGAGTLAAEPELQTVALAPGRSVLAPDNPVSPRLFQFRLVADAPWTLSSGFTGGNGSVPEGFDEAYGVLILREEDLGQADDCALATHALLQHGAMGHGAISVDRPGTYRVLVWNAFIHGQMVLLANWERDGDGARHDVTTRISPWVATTPVRASGPTPGPLAIDLGAEPGLGFATGALVSASYAEGAWSESMSASSVSGPCQQDADEGRQDFSVFAEDPPRTLAANAAGKNVTITLEAEGPSSKVPPPLGRDPMLQLSAVLIAYEPRSA